MNTPTVPQIVWTEEQGFAVAKVDGTPVGHANRLSLKVWSARCYGTGTSERVRSLRLAKLHIEQTYQTEHM